MNLRGNKKTEATTDVVADLQHRTQQAQALASVPRQDLLADARLNPRTRALADDLTARRLRTELELEHRRQLRRERERDRVEERAARRAAAIDEARDAHSNESIALDMTTSRTRFTLGALGASLVCSVGSAMGVEAAVQAAYPGAATGVGYLAEVGMTGMATMAIAWRGGLARSRAVIDGLPNPVLNAMIALPLLASIVASTAGSGPVGAVCSIAAALFAWMAYLVSVTGSEAISQAVGRMDEKRVTATEVPADRHAPGSAASLPRRTPGDGLAVVGDALADEAADYLRDLPAERPQDQTRSHGGPSERSHEFPCERDRSHGEQDNTSTTEDMQVGASERGRSHGRSHGEDHEPERALTAQERRRLEGERNRRHVAAFLSERPSAPTGEIADALNLAPSTVRRLRREIENESGGAL